MAKKCDAHVQEIVKKMSSFYSDNPIFATNTTTVPILLDDDFNARLRSVMYAVKLVQGRKWISYMDNLQHKILSSYGSYISYVFFVCRMDEYVYLNMFERFLAVCGTAMLFCIDTYFTIDVMLDELTYGIIMAYYEKFLKKAFNKHGGFPRLVEYIRCHKHAEWGLSPEDLPLDNLTAANFVRKDLFEKLKKEHKNTNYQFCLSCNKAKELEAAESLAREFLSATKIDLPTLPNPEDLEQKIRNREKEQREFSQVTREMNIASGIQPPAFLLQNPSSSAAKQSAFEELKVDLSEGQRTEKEAEMGDLDEAFRGLSISGHESNLEVKLSGFEETKENKSSEEKSTAEMVQKQHDTEEGLPGVQISKSGTEPNEEVEQEMNSAGCENAEEVIRNKYLESSRNFSSKNQIYIQLMETLQHLNGSIGSIFEVMDHYDKE